MYTILALATLLLGASAAAVPAAANGKTVSPGPGLPSLESLGVTSEQLYAQQPSAFHADLIAPTPNFQAFCGDGRDAGPVDDVIACFNYLQKLGHTQCVIPGDNDQHIMCSAGNARVNGVTQSGHQVSSYCSDVALGVQWVFTNCNRNGQVEGDQAANGNGDLIVVVGGPF